MARSTSSTIFAWCPNTSSSSTKITADGCAIGAGVRLAECANGAMLVLCVPSVIDAESIIWKCAVNILHQSYFLRIRVVECSEYDAMRQLKLAFAYGSVCRYTRHRAPHQF